MKKKSNFRHQPIHVIAQLFDADFKRNNLPDPLTLPERIDWQRTLPFLFLHGGCFAVFWVGVSPISLGAALLFYLIRMFAITGFYHRYFSHRTFKTSRAAQFLFAKIIITMLMMNRTCTRLREKVSFGLTSVGLPQ